MRFGDALNYLMDNPTKSITRSDWYGSMARPRVKLQKPDKHSMMTEPYLYMVKLANREGHYMEICFPLDLSCESILSDKWITLEGDK